MYLDEYEKVSITEFKGLYKRGLADECPADHAICCENVVLNKRGEVSSRPGIAASAYIGHEVRRHFLSVNKNGTFLLTTDGNGNIYNDETGGGVIYNHSDLVDFSAANLGGHTYILPILSTGSAVVQVWDGVGSTRDAAGAAPTSSFSAADGSSGKVDPGDYEIAVCFVTDTGFTTPPGPVLTGTFTAVTYSAPGGKQIDLTGLPTGPSGTIARQIIITKANQETFFFLGETLGGFIDDNTTTTTTLDFFDTDLALSADYLFDLRETIPATLITGTLGLYHNRLCVVANSPQVLVSRVGDFESINMVDGFFTTPGLYNAIVFSVIVQRDVLYAIRFPGIYAVEDNGLEPAFWPVVLVDGGLGSGANGIGTISGGENAATSSDVFLLSDITGMFVFDGSVRRPPLTYKIDDIWKQINWNAFYNVSVFIDVYHDTIYVLVPLGNQTQPNILLVANYAEGMDYQNIKWSIFTFPFTPSAISLMNYAGNMDGTDIFYYLRISFYSNQWFYKYHDGIMDDIGAAINSYYQFYLASGSQKGAMNQFVNLRFRAKGSGNINIVLDAEDFDPLLEVNPPPIAITDPNSKHNDRQINFQKEKMSVGVGTGAFVSAPVVGEYFTINELDIWVKAIYQRRPQ